MTLPTASRLLVLTFSQPPLISPSLVSRSLGLTLWLILRWSLPLLYSAYNSHHARMEVNTITSATQDSSQVATVDTSSVAAAYSAVGSARD